MPVARTAPSNCRWLIFAEESGLADRLVESVLSASSSSKPLGSAPHIASVRPGHRYQRLDQHHYLVDPKRREDYVRLLDDLDDSHACTLRVAHLWNLTDLSADAGSSDDQGDLLDRGFYSLLYLAQAIESRGTSQPADIVVASSGMQHVRADDTVEPIRSTVLGPVRVIPREFPDVQCRSVDFEYGDHDSLGSDVLDQLLSEFEADVPATRSIAYRGGERYVQSFETCASAGHSGPGLRRGGVYLITGGAWRPRSLGCGVPGRPLRGEARARWASGSIGRLGLCRAAPD